MKMNRNNKAWLWFGAAWLVLSLVATAWTLTEFDKCYSVGHNQIECLQQTMEK